MLTTDPGTGVMRHVDAGYEDAQQAAASTGSDPDERARRVSLREIVEIGHPVLRERARELDPDELRCRRPSA